MGKITVPALSAVAALAVAFGVSAAAAQSPRTPSGPAGGGFSPSYGSDAIGTGGPVLGSYPEGMRPKPERPIGAYPDETRIPRARPEVTGKPTSDEFKAPVIPYGNKSDPTAPNADRTGAGNIK